MLVVTKNQYNMSSKSISKNVPEKLSPLDLSANNELKETKRREDKNQFTKLKRRRHEDEESINVVSDDDKSPSKKKESVTLFPGLTITPGESSSKTAGTKTPLMTPSPSPPEESGYVPRFNFGGRTEDEKDKTGNGESVNASSLGFDAAWWHPTELSDLTIPFHGLPAFCKFFSLH